LYKGAGKIGDPKKKIAETHERKKTVLRCIKKTSLERGRTEGRGVQSQDSVGPNARKKKKKMPVEWNTILTGGSPKRKNPGESHCFGLG